jgi:putative toxin-antitoxin system antitoxin component (TIGR02293 family)
LDVINEGKNRFSIKDKLPLPLGKMSLMTTAVTGKTPGADITMLVSQYLRKGASTNLITWLILGGKQFMDKEPASMFDFVTAGKKGIPKLSVSNLSELMNVPMKDMATLLNVSYKTLGRKKGTDTLDGLTSSLSIEIANTFTKGLSVFEDPVRFNHWLQKENRALNGEKPFNLLNTPTGIKLVNQVLGRMEEGVYT